MKMTNVKKMKDLMILETEVETKKAIGLSQYEQYRNRGEDLKYLCYYLYTAIIGTEKVPKKYIPKNLKKKEGPGRPPNNKFLFNPTSKAAKCLIQIIMSCPCIPRIAGRVPPPYPGNRPTDPQQFNLWEKKAKLFVEWYSLLFLPLDENGLPFHPTKNKDLEIPILPWHDTSFDSWNNFWKIFESWNEPTGNNPTTKFCKRSLFQIFTNMVDNLRQ